MSEPYRVQLDVFSGPLDLLLYLIRRDEVDIHDISVARVADQYIEYMRLLETVDPNTAGEFLVMASSLAEIKSRALLPSAPLELGDDEDDPRTALVRKLLEYKRFKDAARALGSAADERAKRYVRRPGTLPPGLRGVELEEVEVWDLLRAFGNVMSAIGAGPRRHEVTYDDTPIEVVEDEIVAILEQEGPTKFRDLFDDRWEKPQIITRFLALLELVRVKRVRAEQEQLFGEIYLFAMQELEEGMEEDEFEEESGMAVAEPLVPEAAESGPHEPGANGTVRHSDAHRYSEPSDGHAE